MSTSRILLPLLLAGGLLVTGCAPTTAQPAPPQAPLAAVPAKGIADVTAPVAALVKNNALTVTADTALAGEDPARKIVKRLVVIYSVGGEQMAAAAMEGETVKIAAPAGQTLKIDKALYGDINYPVVNATEKVRASVFANRLNLPVGVDVAGAIEGQPARDPAPDKAKSLRVDYVVGKTEHSVTVADGQTLTLPAPGDGAGTLTVKSAQYGDLSAAPDLAALVATTFPVSKPTVSSAAIMQAKDIALPRPELLQTPIAPVKLEQRGAVTFADFGLDSFGNLQLTLPPTVAPGTVITIRFGEKLDDDGAIDRKPGGSISFVETSVTTQAGVSVYQPVIPSKGGYQNSGNAIKVSANIGSITPFRYVEIEGSPVELTAANLRQEMVHTAFDDNASSFQSSDATLNAVWDLCKHTMKATTAFGVYIDGERERRPYEADAYINEMSHYAVDLNPAVARYSVEYLLANPTWPTEWSFHMPMMAGEDYRATGDPALAARNYDALKAKLLMSKARPDGLLVADPIVDWPQGERDGYDIKPVNMAVNAFYYHALREMQLLATALGKTDEASDLDAKAKVVYDSINRVFFDPATGLYIDSEGSKHSSLHANMFPLAFDLVPADRVSKVADFVQSRGMATSVYGAQYLLEGLYKAGKADYALSLMTSHDQRSWWNMIASGASMTTEAWDKKFKGNLTWNHPWGAAPANIIARYLVGVMPLTPGYSQISIAPQPGNLASFNAKIPTERGPVTVNYRPTQLEIEVPAGATARVTLPPEMKTAQGTMTLDGKKIAMGAQIVCPYLTK